MSIDAPSSYEASSSKKEVTGIEYTRTISLSCIAVSAPNQSGYAEYTVVPKADITNLIGCKCTITSLFTAANNGVFAINGYNGSTKLTIQNPRAVLAVGQSGTITVVMKKKAMDVIEMGPMGIAPCNSFQVAYPSPTQEVWTFYQDGVLVNTMVLDYTDASKEFLSAGGLT